MSKDNETQASKDAKATQSETLEIELETAAKHRAEKEAEWEEGKKEVDDLQKHPPGDKKDFPAEGEKGHGEFETFGDDETPPRGSPDHDRGIISG